MWTSPMTVVNPAVVCGTSGWLTAESEIMFCLVQLKWSSSSSGGFVKNNIYVTYDGLQYEYAKHKVDLTIKQVAAVQRVTLLAKVDC